MHKNLRPKLKTLVELAEGGRLITIKTELSSFKTIRGVRSGGLKIILFFYDSLSKF